MIDEQIAIQYLWEEFKLRQEHYWASFNRFSLAIITISVIPYVKPDLVNQLDKLIIVFPCASLLLSLACTWLLAAESQRLRMVRQKYDELLREQFKIPRMPQNTYWEKLIAKRIGTATTIMFGIGFIIISLINLLILLVFLPSG